MNYRI